MNLPRGYPRIRLELACGCKEVETAPGSANVYVCNTGPGHMGQDEGEALAKARAALAEHQIVTVFDGGGVYRLRLT